MSVEVKNLEAFCKNLEGEEAELVPSWAVGIVGDGKDSKKGSHGGGWVYNRRRPGCQNENPRLAVCRKTARKV
jgi:hypothetical protein